MKLKILLIPSWEKLEKFQSNGLLPRLEFWDIYWAGGEKHLCL